MLDRDSEEEEVATVGPEPEMRTLVGSTMEVLVLYTGTCVVGARVRVEKEVRVEVSPPEEDVDVAEDVTVFFCAKPTIISTCSRN